MSSGGPALRAKEVGMERSPLTSGKAVPEDHWCTKTDGLFLNGVIRVCVTWSKRSIGYLSDGP